MKRSGWVEESNGGSVGILTTKTTLNSTYVYVYNINTVKILNL
jgi:hypothetical protein